jgi:hypothetical protein
MIDDFAKDYLRDELQWAREALVWKLEGLPEYDVRRPLTATGTNLLGLLKHMATWEARYLGEVFDRPFPEPLPRWQDSDGSDLWVTERESREQIIGFYRRAWTPSVPPPTGAVLPGDAAPERRDRRLSAHGTLHDDRPKAHPHHVQRGQPRNLHCLSTRVERQRIVTTRCHGQDLLAESTL